jgi:hypothetical protein
VSDRAPGLGGKGTENAPELSGARTLQAIRRMGIITGQRHPYYALHNQWRWQLSKHTHGAASKTWRVNWDAIQAMRTFAAALHDPAGGFAIFRRRPVTFSRWQKIKIRWYMWRGKMARAQYVMLEQIGREYDD